MSEAARLLRGSTFDGRYEVVGQISEGGMGAVYEVVHLVTQSRRALKVMRPNLLEDTALRDRFMLEARITGRIHSEHIVDVIDAGVDETTQMPFLVMDLLEGKDLSKLLKQRGRLVPGDVVTYLKQAALALDKTHAQNVIHRDLKPANLFLTHRDDGSPCIKILDFGIAKVIAMATLASDPTAGLGTPSYMAPEQAFGRGAIGPWTDIYALAQVAYALLVGQAYWKPDFDRAASPFHYAAIIEHGVLDAASARAYGVGVRLSPAFDAWFARAAARDSMARYALATIMVDELEAALDAKEGGTLPGPGPVTDAAAVPEGVQQRALVPAGPGAGAAAPPEAATPTPSGPSPSGKLSDPWFQASAAPAPVPAPQESIGLPNGGDTTGTQRPIVSNSTPVLPAGQFVLGRRAALGVVLAMGLMGTAVGIGSQLVSVGDQDESHGSESAAAPVLSGTSLVPPLGASEASPDRAADQTPPSDAAPDAGHGAVDKSDAAPPLRDAGRPSPKDAGPPWPTGTTEPPSPPKPPWQQTQPVSPPSDSGPPGTTPSSPKK